MSQSWPAPSSPSPSLGPVFARPEMDSRFPLTSQSPESVASFCLRGKISLFAEFLCRADRPVGLTGNKHVGHTDRQQNWRSVSEIVTGQV